MNKLNIIEIGFGPHAKRVYAPSLLEYKDEFNINLSLVVDLKEKEEDIRGYFKNVEFDPDFLFIDPFGEFIPAKLEKYLDNYVKENKIKSVIISTEPLTHYVYAKWALKNGLNILMDKPITTEKNVVSSVVAAKKIESDYLDLFDKYNKLQKNSETCFIVNTQRRFHPGFEYVNKLLAEVAVKTNCPITSIQSSHCDGQWRLPNEIVTQGYHPYCTGYGKGSHSGYHIFDTVSRFYKNSKLAGKTADSMEIFSSFVQPRGFLHQINESDYKSYFGDEYESVKTLSDKELYKKYNGYGEIDLSSVVRLKKGDDCVGNISMNLMHNGFGMRTWMKPGCDLYKGNGRVKHEYHNIEQGPFQNIQIHSYQSKDKHDVNTIDDFNLGGNNHFDIYFFRNNKMTGHKKNLEIITMKDLKEFSSDILDDKLAIERIKRRVVREFLSYLFGMLTKNDLTSNIDDHLMPVQIMSGIYRSHNNYMNGKNPIIKYKLNI